MLFVSDTLEVSVLKSRTLSKVLSLSQTPYLTVPFTPFLFISTAVKPCPSVKSYPIIRSLNNLLSFNKVSLDIGGLDKSLNVGFVIPVVLSGFFEKMLVLVCGALELADDVLELSDGVLLSDLEELLDCEVEFEGLTSITGLLHPVK